MAEKPKDWLVVQPSLDPIMAIPNAIIETIDSVLSFLVTLLNIANMILNVIKVFLIYTVRKKKTRIVKAELIVKNAVLIQKMEITVVVAEKSCNGEILI